MASILGDILGQNRKVQIVQGDTVVSIDCSVSESHVRKSPATHFPIEDGETISDHIIIQPKQLTIQGIISDTPISALSAITTTAATAVLGSQIGVVTSAVGQALFSALSGSKKPSIQNYLQLITLQERRQPFNVVTTLTVYKNMFIESLTVPRDAGNGNSLTFTLELIELLLVSPQITNIKIYKDPALAAKEANQGQKPTSAELGTRAGIQAGDNLFSFRH